MARRAVHNPAVERDWLTVGADAWDRFLRPTGAPTPSGLRPGARVAQPSHTRMEKAVVRPRGALQHGTARSTVSREKSIIIETLVK